MELETNDLTFVSSIQGLFFSYGRLAFLKGHLLISGCGQSHGSVKNGWNYLWEQFWSKQPERTETGVRLRVVECENDLEKKTWTLKSYCTMYTVHIVSRPVLSLCTHAHTHVPHPHINPVFNQGLHWLLWATRCACSPSVLLHQLPTPPAAGALPVSPATAPQGCVIYVELNTTECGCHVSRETHAIYAPGSKTSAMHVNTSLFTTVGLCINLILA